MTMHVMYVPRSVSMDCSPLTRIMPFVASTRRMLCYVVRQITRVVQNIPDAEAAVVV